MSSELGLLKQRITELEAENSGLRIKLSISDAELTELKRMHAEVLRANGEHNERRDTENAKLKATVEELKSENAEFRDRLAKVEQKQTLNDNTPNNNPSNFNSDTSLPREPIPKVSPVSSKSSKETEIDIFLDEVQKKKVRTPSEEERPQVLDSVIQPCNRSHKKKGMDELKHELFNPSLESEFSSSINHNNVTEISETARPGKVTYDNLNEASQHLAQLCDKAIDAEDRANRANQEEILCWCLYWKDFRDQLDEIIRSNGGKFGEKKARSMLYDTITEQLSILRKKRSQELGLKVRVVSRDSLRKKTQRAEKNYKLFEKIGLDKIKYINSYSANSISELTDAQFQEIIDYGISLEKMSPEADHVTEISETARPEKILPEVQ